MSAGQAKISLILELKNRIKAGMSAARQTLNSGVSAMKKKAAEMKNSFSDAFDSITSQIPGFSEALSSIGNPIMAITTGILLLAASYGKAAKMAHDWQVSMNKVNVTAQLGKQELKGVSDQLLEIAGRNTGNLMDVPETFNKIISAGFDVNTSLKALEPTLLAAKAGFTDAGTAAEAATNIMGSTGITDAVKVYDVLFATLNKGKAEFADIANYLPKIIPGARQVGVTFEQTAGAFAFLTATGLKAEAASTALANAMKSLSTPDIVFGTDTKAGFKGIGVEIFDATGKIRDLVAISKDLNKAMAGLTDEQRMKKFASIGLDMESSMAFSKMSQGIDQLKDTIDFTTNSQGQLNAALMASADPLDSWYKMTNLIKVEMISWGETAIPILGGIGDWLLKHSSLLKDIGTGILSVAAAWGVYLGITGAVLAAELLRNSYLAVGNLLTQIAIGYDLARAEGMGIVTAAQWALNAAMNANPIGLIITGIGLLIGGLVLAYKHSQTFRAVLSGIMSVASLLADVFVGLGKAIIGAFTFNPKMFMDGAKQTGMAINEIMDGGIAKRFNAGYENKITEEFEADKAKKPDVNPLAPSGGVSTTPIGTPAPGKASGGSSNATKTTGTASQVKNLTINMDAMVKMGDFVSKNPEVASMDKKQLEQFFTEMCARMIANLETSYG